MILITIFIAAIIVTSFINIRLSIALYIAYTILVPYLELSVGGLSLSYNLINTLLLIGFLYWFNKNGNISLDFKIVRPFLFLFGALFLLSFFEKDTPWNIQLGYLRSTFMSACILPFIIWNLYLNESNILTYIKWALGISFFIACIYGIYLMGLYGDNPYTSFLATHFNAKTDAADLYAAFNDPRLSFSTAGKIQSTMIHPMRWVVYLCFMIVITIYYLYKEKKIGYIFFLSLLAFNIFISGVRSGIAALIIGFGYFIFAMRKFKVIALAAVVAILFLFMAKSNTDVANIFASFTDVSGTQSNISGSSIPMRLMQLHGATQAIEGRELTGKGYGWTSYYHSKYGDHPVMLSFESLLIVILCDGGIIGTCIWIIFFFLLFKLNRSLLAVPEDIFLADTIIITYLAYAIGTGDYGYIEIFSLCYTFLVANLQASHKMIQSLLL